MRLVLLIPAFNEQRTIGDVVRSLPRSLDQIDEIRTIVINDGSRDATSQLAAEAGATVLTHRMNRGVGVATATGLKAAKRLDADIAVTMDADGQHDPKELPRLIAPILAGRADVVVGTRLTHPEGMPAIRRIGNKAMNSILRLFWGIRTTDSQSGYRAYGRTALKRLHVSTGGFEVCTEILYIAKQDQLRVTEVPIATIYTEYSKAKGQNPITAFLTLLRFLGRVLLG